MSHQNQPPQPPGPYPWGPPPKKKRHPVRTVLLVLAVPAVIFLVAAILSAVPNGGGSSPQPAGSPSPSSAQPIASSAAAPCTTHQCIAQDADHGLPGAVAKDNSVVTKATCYQSTVRSDGNSDYTVSCTATYSDGSTAKGYTTVELAKNEVLFEPDSYGG